MISGTIESTQFGPCAQFLELFWILAQEQHAPAHRIARGVVAADDQQQDVAKVLARAHSPGRFAVREHGDEVGTRLRDHPFVP
jgi:hypothetical protein